MAGKTSPAVRHVVLAKFRAEGLKESTLGPLRRALESLVGEIDGLVEVHMGPAITKRGNHSYNWAMVCTHRDLESAREYQNHPRHRQIRSSMIEPLLLGDRSSMADALCVIDYLDPSCRVVVQESAVANRLTSVAVGASTAAAVAGLLLRASL
eukprot:FR741634.1.p1 GENE.FR741634.1~~FR741634.1.p1  ORF type:complete len:153 (+),score=7.28 FR741634.1:147-605(+)